MRACVRARAGRRVVKAREHLSPRLPDHCHSFNLQRSGGFHSRRGGVGPQRDWEFAFTAAGGRS